MEHANQGVIIVPMCLKKGFHLNFQTFKIAFYEMHWNNYLT